MRHFLRRSTGQLAAGSAELSLYNDRRGLHRRLKYVQHFGRKWLGDDCMWCLLCRRGANGGRRRRAQVGKGLEEVENRARAQRFMRRDGPELRETHCHSRHWIRDAPNQPKPEGQLVREDETNQGHAEKLDYHRSD